MSRLIAKYEAVLGVSASGSNSLNHPAKLSLSACNNVETARRGALGVSAPKMGPQSHPWTEFSPTGLLDLGANPSTWKQPRLRRMLCGMLCRDVCPDK